ncbi:hypothetical protein BJ165DRAFT_1567250 [Panaeolus papilionaceus]|nr:hypothetical protein BJ165DRAFT_1567250 [Panaeolus papilionaceus]
MILTSTCFELEFGDMGATIARFSNTRDTALSILDMGPWLNDSEIDVEGAKACMYRDLHERIEGALQQKQVIQSELVHPAAQTNPELRALLERNLAANEETLKTFIKEFLTLGFPPAGFEDCHYRLLKSLLGKYIPHTTSMKIFVLRYHLTRVVRNAKRHGSKWFNPRA